MYTQSLTDKQFPPWNNITELRASILANRAIIVDTGELKDIIRQNGEDLLCQIYIHPGKYLPSMANNHFVYQKDFALRDMINYHIQKIMEGGLHHKLVMKHFPPLVQDCQNPIKEVDLSDTIFIFVALASGLISAVLTLCGELIFRHFALRS